MSAFLCLLDRSGTHLDQRLVDLLVGSIRPSTAARSTVCRGPVAVTVLDPSSGSGHSKRAPVTLSASGSVVALAGQFGSIDPNTTAAGSARDLEGLGDRVESLFDRVAGAFVAIEAEPNDGWITIARDHLGSLKVYYYLDRRWLIAASETSVIRRHEAVGNDQDESSVARFLAFRFPHTERSFFRDIHELPPGHCLRVASRESRVKPYWSFRVDRAAPGLPTEGVHRNFLALLRKSIANDLAGVEPERVGVSLSGGLDSTTLMALMPSGVGAYSWYFDDAREGDERQKIEAVSEHLGLPVHWVQGDGLYPLCGDYVERFVDDDSPVYNPFAALKHHLYRTARSQGVETIVVGDGGDALYSASAYWLQDTLLRRGPRPFSSLRDTIDGAVHGDRFAHSALKRLLPLSSTRSSTSRRRVPWLTDSARSLLPGKTLSPILPAGRLRARFDLVAGAKHSDLESAESRLFAQCGVHRSNPFWYWPLVEMVTSLPAYWHQGNGRSKVLTRHAMTGILPARVVEGERTGLLGDFFLRGIEANRHRLRHVLFVQPRSDWQRYVRQAWLEPYLENCSAISFGHTILWRVISYELWIRKLSGCSKVW